MAETIHSTGFTPETNANRLDLLGKAQALACLMADLVRSGGDEIHLSSEGADGLADVFSMLRDSIKDARTGLNKAALSIRATAAAGTDRDFLCGHAEHDYLRGHAAGRAAAGLPPQADSDPAIRETAEHWARTVYAAGFQQGSGVEMAELAQRMQGVMTRLAGGRASNVEEQGADLRPTAPPVPDLTETLAAHDQDAARA